jgi:hypothetical protein
MIHNRTKLIYYGSKVRNNIGRIIESLSESRRQDDQDDWMLLSWYPVNPDHPDSDNAR